MLSSAVMNVRGCSSKLATAVSSPTPTVALPTWQFASMVVLTTRFLLDTILSFDGLLVLLVSTIVHIMVAAPLLTVVSASAAVVIALATHKMYEAYRTFATLAPGGLPTNSFMRAMQLARSGAVPSKTGYLQSLALRPGSTPYVSGTAPHVQINQQSPEDVLQSFTDRLALFADQQPNTTSGSTGNIATVCGCIPDTGLRTFGCVACSAHGTEGSAHVILHPSDLEKVIRNGWGELHPLANTGSYFARSHASSYMPATLALVYAPRQYSEVCTVMRIIESGTKFLASLESTAIAIK